MKYSLPYFHELQFTNDTNYNSRIKIHCVAKKVVMKFYERLLLPTGGSQEYDFLPVLRG